MNLLDKNISYIIISAHSKNNSDYDNHISTNILQDKLYLKTFSLVKLMNRLHETFFFAYKTTTNNELRYDALELLDEFKQESVIVKYRDEDFVKKISFDGGEKSMTLENYDGSEDLDEFFNNGFTFAFKEQKRYYTPQKADDFKKGMILEYKNNAGDWTEKEVIDPHREYNDMYKLLIKYNKVRIPV